MPRSTTLPAGKQHNTSQGSIPSGREISFTCCAALRNGRGILVFTDAKERRALVHTALKL